MITKPRSITKEQYDRAFIFIDEKTANHYLLYHDGDGIENALWIGSDKDSLKTTVEDGVGQKVKGQFYTDETGSTSFADGYLFSTSKSYNDLDLDALTEGRIEWM